MKNRSIKLYIVLLLLMGAHWANAQRNTEIGLTAGVARFYPQASYLGMYSLNDNMDNGFGWTAGAFIQEYLTPKIQQILEVNLATFSSDIYMQKDPEGPWGYGDGSGRQPFSESFPNTSFTSLSASLGAKYYLTRKLFAYPAFVLARSLNQNVTMFKTDYRVKAGLGLNLKKVHVILEYAYGLRDQTRVLDPAVPFYNTTRVKYLQFKVQVPLRRLR